MASSEQPTTDSSPQAEAGGCPFHAQDWSERPNADTIPCPALLTFYQHGQLNPDADGNLSLTELETVLSEVGVGPEVRATLLKGAEKSDGDLHNQKFNLFRLRESSLDHSGSTGIRDPQVSSEKLVDALLRFSESGRMYAEHFAAAANHAALKDPGFKGTLLETLEFTTLLEVFGRLDEQHKRYLTVEDVSGLWLHGKLPEGWQPRDKDAIAKKDLFLAAGAMGLKRLLDKLGL